MKWLALSVLLLAACTPLAQQEGAQCALALLQSGQKDPQALALIAANSIECRSLAADVIQQLIAKAAK